MYDNNELWERKEEPIMKKSLMVVFLLVMASLVALPAAAQQHQGYRMGPEMMDQRYNVQQRTSVDEDKLKAYNEEMEKHYKNTASQRQEILVMQHEIATLLINTKTTKDVVLDKQKELQVLMNNLQRQELSFRWDIHKKISGISSGHVRWLPGPCRRIRRIRHDGLWRLWPRYDVPR